MTFPLRGNNIYILNEHDMIRHIIKILSVNVAFPQKVLCNGEIVITAIFKEPISSVSRIALRRLNVDGDRQADLTMQGGHDKAVYMDQSEHYEYWRQHLHATNLSYGVFGKKFTEGLLEQQVTIGDQFRRSAADEIELVSRDKNNVTVKDIVRLYVDDKEDIVTIQHATGVKALAKGWKDHFRQRIEHQQLGK
jgi:MOSC domain-containing protein YiiM